MIPHIKLSTSRDELLYILYHTQFLVHLCFAMTVNKSQGQSFGSVGVDLWAPVFSYGQLYVALSRVTSVDGLSVLYSDNSDGKTENIIYPEVLLS